MRPISRVDRCCTSSPTPTSLLRAAARLPFPSIVCICLLLHGCGDDDDGGGNGPTTPPGVTIVLLAPVGGDAVAGVIEIRWQTQDASGDDHVDILLSRDSGATYPDTLESELGIDDSPYSWDSSALPDGTTFRVKVNLVDATGEVVTSDACEADFAIDGSARVLIADIPFADPNLAAAVVATGHTYADEVTRVRAQAEGVTSIAGVEYLTRLESLNIRGNSVSDLAPLAGMISLVDLDVGQNDLTDLSVLADLVNLEDLQIFQIPATDLAPLAALTKLEYLHAGRVEMVSLAPLSGLTALDELYLPGCALTDISALSTLTAMRTLSIPNNTITSLDALAGMSELEYLAAFSNQIADLTPLADLPTIRRLFVSDNPITDFSALADLTGLTELGIASTGFDDFSLIAGAAATLGELHIDLNGLSDATSLAQFTRLGVLQAGLNDFTDLSPLTALTVLTELGFHGCNVQDVSFMATLTGLEHVDASNNGVTTGVASLVGLTSAGTIDLAGNTTIPCADLDVLVAALGSEVVVRPASCVD